MALQDVESAGAAAAAPVELDQTRVGRLSRMDAMQSQAMSQDVQRRRRAKLVSVDRAIARLDGDYFGCCEDCAEDINPARLEFDPTVTLCVGCAAKREQ